jgi:hypothetical protein
MLFGAMFCYAMSIHASIVSGEWYIGGGAQTGINVSHFDYLDASTLTESGPSGAFHSYTVTTTKSNYRDWTNGSNTQKTLNPGGRSLVRDDDRFQLVQYQQLNDHHRQRRLSLHHRLRGDCHGEWEYEFDGHL